MAAITGLAAGTNYHFRVTATNAKGTTQSADQDVQNGGCELYAPAAGARAPTSPTATRRKNRRLPETVKKFSPAVTVAGSAMTVASNGSFTVKLSCPRRDVVLGTVTLRR